MAPNKLGTVAHECNPTTQKVEAGGQSGLKSMPQKREKEKLRRRKKNIIYKSLLSLAAVQRTSVTSDVQAQGHANCHLAF